MRKFQPMLASKADLGKVNYPCIVSPKLDGIRCVIKDSLPLTRKLKPIPNSYIRNLLFGLDAYDGEIMIPGKGFNDVQSAVMSESGTPDFEYHIFDMFSDPSKCYIDRYNCLNLSLREDLSKICKLVKYHIVNNEYELLEYLEKFIKMGYEGLMIRSLNSPYKFGRSTLNEGYLLKVKKFFDDEAVLTGMIEKMHNTNAKEKDEIGNSKRSSHKSGMLPADTVGTFLASWRGKDIRLGFGQGITDFHKQEFWNNKDMYIGKTLTFKYQELSPDEMPRFPKFVGFRYDLN